MEEFTGNGAECMVRFVADGVKGAVYLGEEDQMPIVNKVAWHNRNEIIFYSIAWLGEQCTYYPPEPTYRNATAKEALCAYWIDSKDVEYQLTAMAPIEGPRKWMPITTDYKAWADPYRIYRIMED